MKTKNAALLISGIIVVIGAATAGLGALCGGSETLILPSFLQAIIG